jgi:hypothetical protein
MGLFLLLTPANWVGLSSLRGMNDSDLIIKRKDGSTFNVDPKDANSIIVLVGSGFTNWLYPGTSMRAAVHAVNTISGSTGDHRVVLGRMFLPPMDSVSKSGIKFEDFFFAPLKKNTLTDSEHVVAWRRLTEAKCEAGQKYCWMDCMPDVDCGGEVEAVCMNQKTGKTCLETDCDMDCKIMCPAVTANPLVIDSPESTTTSSRKPEESKRAGSTTTSSPKPLEESKSQKPSNIKPRVVSDQNIDKSSSRPPEHVVVPNNQAHSPANPRGGISAAGILNDDVPFCRGGTSMVMSGFESVMSHNANCIILFFRPWLLDNGLKFAFGCIGVFLLGFLVEATIKLRRSVTNRVDFKAEWMKNFAVTFLFGINVALGYICMLAAMTFNVEIFISTVTGLAIGHLVLGNSSQPVRETADPCCVTSEAINANQGLATSLVNSTGACCCDTRK